MQIPAPPLALMPNGNRREIQVQLLKKKKDDGVLYGLCSDPTVTYSYTTREREKGRTRSYIKHTSRERGGMYIKEDFFFSSVPTVGNILNDELVFIYRLSRALLRIRFLQT